MSSIYKNNDKATWLINLLDTQTVSFGKGMHRLTNLHGPHPEISWATALTS